MNINYLILKTAFEGSCYPISEMKNQNSEFK